MDVIYANMKPRFDKPSIFLAGPTYRKGDEVVEGSFWRKDAIRILEELQFDGIVFSPEIKGEFNWNYDGQVEWEYECLENCKVIVFWIPRNVKHLPAFTTNVEFGRYVGSNRIVYGRPDNSEKNRYLDWLYFKVTRCFPHSSLHDVLGIAIQGYL